MHRTYENDDLVVFWDSDRCFHAKKCVTGSPATFDPTTKPWIRLGRAKNSEVWQMILMKHRIALGSICNDTYRYTYLNMDMYSFRKALTVHAKIE